MKTAEKHSGDLLEKVGGYETVDCRECGYIHIRPMPALNDLKKLYAEKFYGKDKADYLQRMEQDLEWWNMVYEERLETLERLLGKRRSRRILDVGCSGGFFLSAARRRGWQTQGVELARQAARYAQGKGLSVIEADVHDVNLDEIGPFDAVYSSFVFEHLPDPVLILEKFKRALAPGGIVCVEVPNDFNPLQKIVRSKLQQPPYWVVPDHHLNYFTPESLRGLFKKCGFGCAEMEGTFPMELFLLMGDNYVGNDPVGRQMHGKRKRMEKLMHDHGLKEFKRQWYRFFIERGIGREIVLYARK